MWAYRLLHDNDLLSVVDIDTGLCGLADSHAGEGVPAFSILLADVDTGDARCGAAVVDCLAFEGRAVQAVVNNKRCALELVRDFQRVPASETVMLDVVVQSHLQARPCGVGSGTIVEVAIHLLIIVLLRK